MNNKGALMKNQIETNKTIKIDGKTYSLDAVQVNELGTDYLVSGSKGAEYLMRVYKNGQAEIMTFTVNTRWKKVSSFSIEA